MNSLNKDKFYHVRKSHNMKRTLQVYKYIKIFSNTLMQKIIQKKQRNKELKDRNYQKKSAMIQHMNI